MLYSSSMKPVMLPPGWAKLATKPAPTGSATVANTTGSVVVDCCSAPTDGLGCEKSVWRERNQLVCKLAHSAGDARAPTDIDYCVSAVGPSQSAELRSKDL
jgi:hypothetical protein